MADCAKLLAWPTAAGTLAPGWGELVQAFVDSAEGARLSDFLAREIHDGATVYPPQPLRALELTALADLKVVIIGQDPYHGPGQAQGLAFSVAPGQRLPPSLRNMFKELQRDLGLPVPADGSLERWARQGVLLLNTSLTVQDARPGSHAGQGWESLTDDIVRHIDRAQRQVVFLLWGAHAQKKKLLLHRSLAAGQVLCANHPSPLSALRPPVPFLGCGHFGTANRLLLSWGRAPVDW